MKAVKRILIALALIIVVALVAALFVDKNFDMERSAEINRPKDQVFDYLSHLKNHDQFTVWSKADPNTKKDFRGEDATVGFVSAWDSQHDEVGAGEQEITAINPGQSIDTKLRFIRPFEGEATSAMVTEPIGNDKTLVRWQFHSEMPYPMNLMRVFMNMEENMAGPMEQGLSNLKNILESNNTVVAQ